MNILFKSSASSLIVLNFVSDLFWEHLSHETPARQSSLHQTPSQITSLIQWVYFFLWAHTYALFYPIWGACADSFALTLHSFYTLINMLVCDWNICSNQLKFCRSKQMIREVWGGEGTEMMMTYFSFWTKVSLKNIQHVTPPNWSLIWSTELQSSHPTP